MSDNEHFVKKYIIYQKINENTDYKIRKWLERY